jgi:hypothetical protein
MDLREIITLSRVNILIICGVVTASALDVFTFIQMIQLHGIGAEANPLVAAGYNAGGIPLIILGKWLSIVSFLTILKYMRNHREHLLYAFLASVGIILPIYAAYTNVMSL